MNRKWVNVAVAHQGTLYFKTILGLSTRFHVLVWTMMDTVNTTPRNEQI
jgi:hypothetical protein